ncbi:MAG: serine/threonine-protein kinase [Oscillospiraceae bacterium]|nr:serine/threonine-protein kinase [Oscillospiraceae bacterium]
MSRIGEAVLASGKKIPYVITDNPPRGGMKYTYFSPDKSYVVQFFNDPKRVDFNMRSRIEAIIGKYNPTIPESAGGAVGNDERLAAYFEKRFCWPTDIVISPEFGLVSPSYPSDFFFDSRSSQLLDLDGKDKKSNWFTSSNRRFLNKSELGDFRSMLQMSLLLSRSIRRLHQAGLAHSDLSNNNVLIDPKSGNCVVIDIDSLVVPGLYPPEVAGTRGYIAPEVLATMELDRSDPRRKIPGSTTDLHALAVLIYEYLLFRHPLMGPKIFSSASAEEDDFLALGPQALFIENPYDTSNRPSSLKVTIKDLGPMLERLFIRAFVDGLHDPSMRPSAMEWEKGITETWDLLHRCSNPSCDARWFVLYDVNSPICPFCGTKITDKNIVRLSINSEVRGHSGQWRKTSEVDASNNTPLFKWHTHSNIFPDEKADTAMQAYVCCHDGEWFLINSGTSGMRSPQGNLVPSGQAIRLRDGTVFRASEDDRGTLIRVTVI